MPALSKFVQEHIRSLTCQEFLHSETCRKHLTMDILLFAKSNFKYFAPICLLPALARIQKMNRKKVQKTLEYYLSCSVIGTCVGFSVNVLICFLRNKLGYFGYYSFLFIPTFLASFVVYLGPRRVIDLYETSIFQCTIETFFLMRKNFISRTIADSRVLQTFLFMSCSAIILHSKQVYNTHGFWLLSPNPKVEMKENVEQCLNCELHPQKTCKEYLINGMRTYFILGLSLDIIKMLMGQVKSTQNTSKFVGKLKNFRIRSMVLLTAYIGIYRFSNCWLNSKGYCSNICNHILSSFLAGSCFYLNPQSSLLALALVQATRSLWTFFKVSNIDNKNEIVKQIITIPYAKILYPFALANMIHLVVVQPKYTSYVAEAIANGLANKYPALIQNKIKLLKIKHKFSSY